MNKTAAQDKPKSQGDEPIERHLEDLTGLDAGDEGEPHADERWLISYADMMTLLFGLFVMLYALAMETQGRPQEYFADLVGDKQASSVRQETEKKMNGLIARENELNTALLTTKKELESLNSLKAQSDQKLEGLLAEKERFEKEIDGLKNSLHEAEGRLQRLPTSAVPQVKAPTQDAKLSKDLAETRQKLAAKEVESAAAVKQIADLKKEIDLLTFKENEFASMSQQMAQMKTEMAELSEAASKSFMVVTLKWETEKHDLDLRVTDPNGKSFDFQKRTHKGVDGRFVLDSRSGPGVEMWETPKAIPGDYRVEFSFYNNYGNTAPAKVSGAVITRNGEFPLPNIKMDMGSANKKSFVVHVSDKGEITIK